MNSLSFSKKLLFGLPAGGYYLVQKTWEKMFLWGLRGRRKVSIPVISVGNLLMGGSGKTPFVIFLAAMLRENGLKPAVVSRGYGGTNRNPYCVVSDGKSVEPSADPLVVGDEPFLIAQRLKDIPVLIGAKRHIPAEAARSLFGSDIIVLDDGFQHLQLARDLDIVLLNGTEDDMFPLGRLREPMGALQRAHIIVLMGQNATLPSGIAPRKGIPIFKCRTVPVSVQRGGTLAGEESPGIFSGQDVILLSGIADPARFRRTAEDLGWKIREHYRFRDHHVFTEQELARVLASSSEIPVVVTEKDWVKLPDWFKKQDRAAVLRIETTSDEEPELRNAILERIV